MGAGAGAGWGPVAVVAAAAASAAGCTESPTRLVARIDSDLAPCSELRRVVVVAQRENGPQIGSRELDLCALSLRYPGEVAIAPKELDDGRRVVLTVTGTVAGAVGAEGYTLRQEFVTPFQRGRTMVVRYSLVRACATDPCPSGFSCVPGPTGEARCAGREAPVVFQRGDQSGIDAAAWDDAVAVDAAADAVPMDASDGEVRSDASTVDVRGDVEAIDADAVDADGRFDVEMDIAGDDRADVGTLDAVQSDAEVDAGIDVRTTADATDEFNGRDDVVTDWLDASDPRDGPSADSRPDAPEVDTAPSVDVRVTAFAGSSCTAGAIGCGRVNLPGGTFRMGDGEAYSFEDTDSRAIPEQMMIAVDAFSLDRYEVTVERFRAFAAARPSFTGFNSRATDPVCNWTSSPGDREGHPMNCVDWQTAQAFCEWDTPGGRLPTEAQWEFAARGAGTSNRVFPWGNDPAAPQSWICSHRSMPALLGTCTEVDTTFSRGCTPEGVCHLLGNVYEWTADVARPYTNDVCWNNHPRTNPVCTVSGVRDRSLRGSSWVFHAPSYLRAGHRLPGPPTNRDIDIGFRCAGNPG